MNEEQIQTLKNIIEIYKKQIVKAQESHDTMYDNEYHEGLDVIIAEIETLERVVKDLENL